MADILKPVYGTVWAETGEKLSPIEAKLQSGWVQEMMPYQYENFLQNRQDVAITYLLQKGVAEWSSGQEYIANKSIVSYLSNLYVSTATSTGITPTDTTYWRKLTVTFDVNGTIPVTAGGTGATSATDARTNLGLGTAATLSADTIVLKALSGGAPYADRWTNAMSLTVTGGASGTTSFDGSVASTLNLTSLNANTLSGDVPIPSLANAVIKTSATGSAILPSGTTAQRDTSPMEAYTRWNTTNKTQETFNGTSWTVTTAQNEAYVLNRANHTGVQVISTITGLQTALDSTVKKTSDTGAALVPEGSTAQRPTVPASVLAIRGNTQDGADYKPEFWDRVASAWKTFADRTWVGQQITTASDAVKAWVDTQIGFTIIYPNGGTAAAPGRVAANSRYVTANPFPGHHVICVAEVWIDGWGDVGWDGNSGTAGSRSYGTRAGYLPATDQVVVQTGNTDSTLSSALGGGVHGYTTGAEANPLCRVKVWRLKG